MRRTLLGWEAAAAAPLTALVMALAAVSPAADATSGPPPPSTVGQWSVPFAFPTIPIHAHLLPTGQVLFWDRHDTPEGDGHPRLWNPVSGSFRAAPDPPPGHDLFCSGHAFLEDGRLFVAGGHFGDGVGQPFASIYDPFDPGWTMAPEMSAGRWYPTATTLADGSVLLFSGNNEEAAPNPLPQIYRPASLGWRNLEGALRDLPYYPLAFQAPDGRVFLAAPEANATLLDPVAPGAWSAVDGSGHGFRTYGSAVAYGAGKILLAGGGDPPTAAVETIDLTTVHPAFRELPPMAAARRQLNLTLLPDGTVLATGGTSAAGFNNATGAVLATELFRPASESWTTLAAMAVPRIYHSVALLLPDARVLVAGGGHPSDSEHGDSDHFDAQLFSPPYLFQGPRPAIVEAPETVRLGEAFAIETLAEPAVASVSWVRLGSVTHGFNMNQRFVSLLSTPSAKGRTVVAPSDPRLAPPGHYLMFALTAEGVPSVARIVRLAGGVFGDGFESGATGAWSDAAR